MVGGDTNESKELVIDCAMFGFAEEVVGRKGASPGELVAVTGTFGLPPAGLEILELRARCSEGFRRRAVRSVLYPSPNLRVGLSLAPYLTSSMDSSDGLARSLHTLCGMSRVGFELDTAPVSGGVKRFARENGLDLERLVWAGGEEYVMVGTLRRKDFAAARRAATRAGGDLLAIGKVTKGSGVVLSERGRARPIPDEGWTHLG